MANKFGERLIEAGLLTPEKLAQGLEQQKLTGHRLGESLFEIGLLKEADLLRLLAAEFNTRFVSAEKLSKTKISTEVLDRVPVRMAEAQLFLPLAVDEEQAILSIVMAEPQNQALTAELKLVTGMEQIVSYVAMRSTLLAGIKKHYYGDNTAFEQLAQGGPLSLRPEPPPESRGEPRGSTMLYREGSSRGGSAPSAHRPVTQFGQLTAQPRASTLSDQDFVDTLNVMVGLMESGRPHLQGHSAQLARQATQVARRLGLSPKEVLHVALAAQLHGLGKPAELHFSLSTHAAGGEWRAEAARCYAAPVKLFEAVHLPGAVNAILAQLYEAFDGSGVPQGAKGEEIALGARILAAVDSFLDLTSSPNHPLGHHSKDAALAHLTERAGSTFDPNVVRAVEGLLGGELQQQQIRNDGRQVLVAEPDPALRTLIADALARVGAVPHSVDRLEGVLDALMVGDADVVVLSVGFGQAEVEGVVEFLRKQAATAGVPVLVVGALPSPAAEQALGTAGVDEVLPWPLDEAAAGQRILHHLQERARLGGPARPVRGSLNEVGLIQVVKALAAGRKTGRLSLKTSSQGEGFFHFERGRVLFAKFEEQQADAALTALGRVTNAEFTYDADTLLMELPHVDVDLEVVVRRLSGEKASA